MTRVRSAAAVCCALVSIAAGASAQSRSDAGSPARLLGTWRGTSVCTDRVAAPSCRDETVVYELSAGKSPGTVHWAADKVVDGRRQRMYELELAYDEAGGCWKAEFDSPRFRGVWRLVVEGTRLTGTARLLPGNATVRKLDLRKD